MNEKMELIILGENLGTAKGWDQPADWCLYFFKVELNTRGKELFGDSQFSDLGIDLEHGTFSLHDNEGNTLLEGKLGLHRIFEDTGNTDTFLGN